MTLRPFPRLLAAALAVAFSSGAARTPAASPPPAAALPGPAAQALETIARHAAESRSDAVLIVRDGEVLFERGSADPEPIELMSATKSVVALGIGLLLADGLLESLDAPVATWFPEWRQGRKREITVRMLLDHTSGLQNAPNAGAEIYPAPDVVQLALAAELDAAPGETFSYNNKATNLLAGVVARASGRPLDVYLGERLFAPLGIRPGAWYRDEAGNPHAMAGLPLTARDAARLGQLLLDDGRLPDGTRLLPEGFVEALWRPGPRSDQVGLLWWRVPAWQRLSLRADAAERLAAHGVAEDVAQALLGLAGRSFDDPAQALHAALGEDWGARYVREVTERGLTRRDLFDEARGPVIAYAAIGYLGQYIVVVPGKRLVAVRQIRRREDHRVPRDDYAAFQREAIALAEALPDMAP
ncbi:serine hydrolase domain-containing protein [Luteimonas huabeiensis]|uniref:serine hydrolase domain-containing protein n=1 Tax=Luteimonas huabeiensis TaxID=1244513 RepID=UPI000463E38A|nr:serine hydrolase domain-containing protein [Luteimonas huabeiensis]